MKIVASSGIKSKAVLIAALFTILFSVSVGISVIKKNSAVSAAKTDEEKTVVIDAGHGGIDGGASADDGTLEKDINLSIALKLQKQLVSMGIKNVMTRTEDRSIHDDGIETIKGQKVSDLHNRLKIIDTTPNSIFISIHQNHYSESKYSGTQIFYSKNNPDSLVLAEKIRALIIKNIQPDNKREIKKSGSEIFLLNNSNVPSVMIECGFLSNKSETELLKDEEYQNKLAESIAFGIRDYINYSKER